MYLHRVAIPGRRKDFFDERFKAMQIRIIAFLGLIFAAYSGQSHAGIVLSRAALNGTDFVDWGTLGPAELQPNVPNPSAFTSNGGIDGFVSVTTGDPVGRRDQDIANVQHFWSGNFNPGDHLLWTATDKSGPNSVMMVLAFGSQGITRGGAQIQPSYTGAEFVARISAFDSNDVLLGTYTRLGVSNEGYDNSAIFLGVEGLGIIHRIEFSLDSAPGGNTGGFAINQFDFSAEATAVPEPSSLALYGIGAAGLFIATARQRRNTPPVSV